jgi:hypothetical protein
MKYIKKFEIRRNKQEYEKDYEKYIGKYIIFRKNPPKFRWSDSPIDNSLYIGKVTHLGSDNSHIEYYEDNLKTPSYYGGVDLNEIKILGSFDTLDDAMEMYAPLLDVEKYNL